MKRRDFVKIAALLPVAPAMVAANQFAEPKQISATPAYRDELAYRDALAKCLSEGDGWQTGFTCVDTKRPQLDGFWVAFDDVEKQTNFLKRHFSKEDFWHGNGGNFKNFNTVSSVETIRFSGDAPCEVTNISFSQFGWFAVWVGAKISINVVDRSIRIEQTGPSGKALDWKWTRETYEETVIRVAIEFDALYPGILVSFAKAEKVPQTQIKDWMREKKSSSDFVLRSHFKAAVTSGIRRGARS